MTIGAERGNLTVFCVFALHTVLTRACCRNMITGWVKSGMPLLFMFINVFVTACKHEGNWFSEDGLGAPVLYQPFPMEQLQVESRPQHLESTVSLTGNCNMGGTVETVLESPHLRKVALSHALIQCEDA